MANEQDVIVITEEDILENYEITNQMFVVVFVHGAFQRLEDGTLVQLNEGFTGSWGKDNGDIYSHLVIDGQFSAKTWNEPNQFMRLKTLLLGTFREENAMVTLTHVEMKFFTQYQREVMTAWMFGDDSVVYDPQVNLQYEITHA